MPILGHLSALRTVAGQADTPLHKSRIYRLLDHRSKSLPYAFSAVTLPLQ
jgi:hypothetical protein